MKFLKLLNKSNSINKKILLLATLSSLIPLVIISIFSFFYFSSMAEKKVATTTSNFLNIADWNIDTFIVDIESIGSIILGSNDAQNFLKQKADESYYLRTATKDLLINITNNKHYINGIYLGNGNVEYFIKNSGESKYTDNFYNQIRGAKTFEKIIKDQGKASLYKAEDINLVKDNNAVSYGKAIYDINTFKEIGILLISFDNKVFEEMFGNIQTEGNIIIAGRDGSIYFNQDVGMFSDFQISSILSNLDSEGLSNKKINNNDYVINYKTNSKTGWKVISVIPYKSLISDAINVRNITFILIICSFVLALISAFFITNRITNQLTVLTTVTKKMEKGEGKLEHISFDIEDEIGRIGNRLIALYNRNNNLLVQLYETKLKAKEAELLTLQSHINPHFLYNTLNSIYWMAEKHKVKPIAKIALSMSKYFKLVLNNGDFITTVQNEIDQVEKYLEIMNVRHAGKIDISIEVDSDILNERIIKLLIQPLVENAINHGLAMKEGKKELTILGKSSKRTMIFEVIDNGIGFNLDKVVSEQKGYALSNISNRIKLFYGEEYGLTINSSLNKGTIAKITVTKSISHKG